MVTKKSQINPKERAFIEVYLTCWNGAEAARRAGYSVKTARATAHNLLTKAYIREEIDRRLAQYRMSADEVIARLAAQAQGSLEPFLSLAGEDVTFDLNTREARAHLHLIKEIETDRRTYGKEDNPVEEVKIKLKIHDPQAALIQLGRYYGLFKDRVRTFEDDIIDYLRDGRITHDQLRKEYPEGAARLIVAAGLSPDARGSTD